jgi:hypothetical protein
MTQGNTPDGYGEEPGLPKYGGQPDYGGQPGYPGAPGYRPPEYGPQPGYPPPPPGYAPQPGYGPPPGYGPAQGGPPPSYLPWAIVSTILCCLPAGVVAIVFAAQVSGKWRSGNAEGAWRSSKNAKLWTIISAVAGVAVAIVLLLVGLFGSTHSSGTVG